MLCGRGRANLHRVGWREALFPKSDVSIRKEFAKLIRQTGGWRSHLVFSLKVYISALIIGEIMALLIGDG